MIGLRQRLGGAGFGCLVLVCRLTPAALGQANPVVGGTLNVGLPSDCKTMDPIYSVQFTERQVLYLVFNTLVRYGPDFSIHPELAESWSIEEEGANASPSSCDGASSFTMGRRLMRPPSNGISTGGSIRPWLPHNVNSSTRSSLRSK